MWHFSDDYYRMSRELLDTSLAKLGAYQAWRAFDPGPGSDTDTRYAAMPALTKADIRQHFPAGFLPPGREMEAGLASGEISLVNTSGTTGDRVTNIWNQTWWDASERASWQLNARTRELATGNHPEAILVSPLNVGFRSDDVELPMEQRRLDRYLYLNEKSFTRDWTPEYMDRMLKELDIFQPSVLEANPSLLATLCRYAAAAGKTVFQPGLIVFTYEYPTRFHYRQIGRVFSSPTASSFGTTECGYVFMQCEEGKLHQNSQFCRVDFQPFKPEHGGPSLGRILVTTFNNPWYYMLRFDTGDIVRLDTDTQCACGRDTGMILSAVEGRGTNLTLTGSGRLVTLRELDEAVSVLDGIDEYRLDQKTPDSYHLYLASSRADKDKLRREATAILQQLYGQDARVTVVFQHAIEPEASGKYRLARADFPIDIESYLEKGARTGHNYER